MLQARDEFFKCVADSGVTFTAGGPIPRHCRRLRAAFEKACKPSWVRHFDAAHDQELRLVQTLRANINASASAATGGLAGKDQQAQ